jgi:large subunit ribosomal protein L6
MSRVGKKPIIIPDGVEVKLEGKNISVKGSKGTLDLVIHEKSLVEIVEEEGKKTINVNPLSSEDREAVAMWGTTRSLIANLILGVTEGFSKSLEVVGVGYKVKAQGKDMIVFEVGYSHPVEFRLPNGIEVNIEKNTVKVSGIDRQLVGEVAARMRKIKKPEPYKGKGIRYSDEQVRRKAGKAAKASE